MFLMVTAFSLGVFSLQFFSILPALIYCFFVVFVVLIAEYFVPVKFKKIVMLLIIFCLGFTWVDFRAEQSLQWHLPASLIKKPVVIEGRIFSLPKASRFSTHFNVQVTQFNGRPLSTRISLSWYRRHLHLNVGDLWRLTVKLKPPHGLRNPGGFDYQQWLFMQGIRATGYVVNKAPNRLLHRGGWYFPVDHLRQRIERIIQEAVTDPALAAVLITLTVGSRSAMRPSQWQVFQNTGTSHLMAISGLHVGLIAGAVYFLLNFLWCLFPRACLRIPSPRVAALGALIAALLYGLLAGFSLPTQRAVMMIAVVMLGHLFYQSIAVWRRLLLALFIIVVWQPFALWSVSFWLSFGAVAWIGYGMSGRLEKKRGFKVWLRLQWVVFLGLLPLTLYFFQRFSLAMWLANIPAIPWVGMLIVPLCLVASLACLISIPLGHGLFWLAAKALMPLWWWLRWLASVPHVVWFHALVSAWVLFTCMVGVLLLLAPKGWPGRWLGLIWMLPLFFYRLPAPPAGGIWLTLLDVGEGLSAVVRTQHHVLLYDAGPRSYGGFDAGQSVVVPYLTSLGIHKIDTMMISHGDNDHIGGSKAVLAQMPVARILTSVPQRFKGFKAQYCHTGQAWRWDGVDFRVLSPPAGEVYQGNNSSCVLKVSIHGRGRLLLVGDIEKPRERWLLQHAATELPTSIIVAPHHGSRTSSSVGFVKQIGVKDVLFPVGYYNRYGFPRLEVMVRYQNQGARAFTSAHDGAIKVRISPGGSIRINTYNERQFFWQQ